MDLQDITSQFEKTAILISYGESQTKVLKRGFSRREVQLSDGSHLAAGHAWSAVPEAVLFYRDHIGKPRSEPKHQTSTTGNSRHLVLCPTWLPALDLATGRQILFDGLHGADGLVQTLEHLQQQPGWVSVLAKTAPAAWPDCQPSVLSLKDHLAFLTSAKYLPSSLATRIRNCLAMPEVCSASHVLTSCWQNMTRRTCARMFSMANSKNRR